MQITQQTVIFTKVVIITCQPICKLDVVLCRLVDNGLVLELVRVTYARMHYTWYRQT